MANATVSRLGQANLSGDTDALFLKVFSGEVLTAFEEANIFDSSKHMVRSIMNGKSATFPVTWKVTASYHTPGNEITGGQVRHGERVISIDDLLIAPVFIANIDEARNHFDVRSIYSTEMGRSLAAKRDANVAAVMILAARGSAVVTGAAGGTEIKNASMDTDASVILSALWEAAQTLDENDIPESERYAYFRPAQYYLLNQNTTILNRDYAGSGSYAEGGLLKVNGIPIIKTNHLPSTDLSADVSVSPSARADFSNTYGLVAHKSAAGTVQLMDLALESEYQINRQGTLMVGRYAVGHGLLRPEAAVELTNNT